MPDEYELLLDSKLKSSLNTGTQGQDRAMQSIQMPGQTVGLPSASRPATFEERNRQGLPIDVESGVPAMIRLGVAMRDTEEDQMAYLSGIFGPGTARKADNGDWLVKVIGEDGKPQKEVLVNERGFTARDAFSMLGYAPETIGALASMRGGRSIPKIGASKGVGGFLRDVAAEAIGQEAGGAAKDVAVRLGQGTEADIGEIAARRASNVPYDAIIGGFLGVAGKATSKLITPLGPSREIVDIEAKEGAEALGGSLGIGKYPTTVGEVTGGPAFKRIEATAAQLPGSSKYFREVTEQKTGWLRKAMDRILGTDVSPVPSAEDAGESAVSHIRSKLTPVQEAVEASRNDTLKLASDKVMKDLGTSPPGLQMKPERVGAAVRQKIMALRDEFTAQNRLNYGKLDELGGKDRLIESPGLAQKAKDLIKELPPISKEVEEVAYDNYGSPMARISTRTEPSREFVPENVAGKLKELAAGGSTKRSLSDLIAIKNEISDDIAEGEAVKGRQTRFLTKASKMVDEEINRVLSLPENAELKTVYDRAKNYYKDNVGKFKNKYVARLFREIDEGGGFINDEDIVHNIGPTEYTTFKELLGDKSPEFANLKQSISDSLFNASLFSVSPDPGATLVDGKKLLKNISNFYKDKRTIAEDVFGTKIGSLENMGKALQASESLSEVLGTRAKVDLDKLRAAIGTGEPVSKAIMRLAEEQRKLDTLYRSKILKDIGEGNVGKDFNAADFVNRFYDTSSKKEVEAVMAQLSDNPEAVEKLRRKMVQKVFFEAQRSAKASDPLSLGAGDPLAPPNATSLKKAMGDMDRRGSLQTILGRDLYDSVVNLGKVVRGSEVNEQAFKAAGGLVAGGQTGEMLKGGLFRYANNYVRQMFASIVLSSPILRKWASNGVMEAPLEIGGVRLANTKGGALVTTLIASTPFLEAVQEEFGEGAAGDAFLTALRRSVNLYERQQAKSKKEPEVTPEQLLDKRIFEAGKPERK